MAVTNYYDILKIDSKSDLSTIKKAFRKEIALYHPDNNTSPEAPKQFELIVEAFDVLSNTEKRKVFDTMLEKDTNNSPLIIETKEKDAYEDWQKQAKTKSKKYRSSPLEELLMLDIFIDLGLSGIFSGTDATFDNIGDSLDGIGDAIDGIFDLF